MEKSNNPQKDFDGDPKDLKKMLFKNQYPLHMVQYAVKTYLNSSIDYSAEENQDSSGKGFGVRYFKLPCIG